MKRFFLVEKCLRIKLFVILEWSEIGVDWLVSRTERRSDGRTMECGRVSRRGLIAEITSSHSSPLVAQWKKREFSVCYELASVS